MKTKKLTPKQKKFAELVAKNGKKNAKKWADEAGYKKNPEKWAEKLLKDKQIKAEIKRLTPKKEEVKSEAKEPRKAGRPTEYKEEYNEQVYKLCLLGATDKQIADFLNVDESTINNWKIEKEGFLESIKKGKLNADAEIAKALYHRAKGYEHPEDKIFNNNGEVLTVKTTKHYPPDTAAAMIWLKNRQPKQWRDKQEIESSNVNINMNQEIDEEISEQDASRIYQEVMKNR